MKEAWGRLVDRAKKYWNETPKATRIVHGSVVGGILLLALIVAVILNVDHYVPLYYDLSASETQEVLAALADTNADFKLQDGNIVVPERQQRAIVGQLAQQGYPKSGFNYDFITEGGIMATDYEKRQRAVYQLQENVSTTIETIKGVKSADVIIQMQDDSVFVLQQNKLPASATVMIEPRTGHTISAEQAAGILLIVEKSVPGLLPENIAIVDSNGTDLKTMGVQMDMDTRKINLQRYIDNNMKAKVASVIEPFYGTGNYSVVATSVLDIDEKITEEITYLPSENNTGVLTHWEWERENVGSSGTAQGVPGTETNADIPGYPARTDEGDGSYNKDYGRMDYSVSSLKQQVKREGFVISDVTIALAVDKTRYNAEDHDAIVELVAAAAGVRSSKVSLYSTDFAQKPKENFFVTNRDFILTAAVALAGIILLVVLLVSILRFLKRREEYRELHGLAADGPRNSPEPVNVDALELVETREQALKSEIRDLAGTNPEIIAQLLKTLIREEDE